MMSIAVEHASARLREHASYQTTRRVEPLSQLYHRARASTGQLLADALGLPQNSASNTHHPAIEGRHSRLARRLRRRAAARGPATLHDFEDPANHTTRTAANTKLPVTDAGDDALHRARQHPDAVGEQR